ncbi:MAG: HIT family protein [Candidatus Pacebacteria bacterium]|nr:HIT family protein [Candidatus Paceibacterota bacterium]
MDNCLFCKIIANEIPAHKVYEDDLVLAFLDIRPISKGHTLIVPKKHTDGIFSLDEETMKRIGAVAKKVAQKMKDVLGADGVNLYHASGASAEQTVFHFHLHVIPRRKDDDICFTRAVTAKEGVKEEELEETAGKLKIGS